MNPAIHTLIFLTFAVFAVAMVFIASAQAKKRRAAMLALAAELGLDFDPSRDRSHDDRFAHYEIFRRGHSRSSYNRLVGTTTAAGLTLPVNAGDFQYTVTSGSGKDRRSTTYRFSYLIVQLPFDAVPDLLIRHEGLLDKIAAVFSDRDIDFESEEFSRKFMVASPDRKFAYDICHPRMIEFLLAAHPPPIDIEQTQLCLSDGTRAWTPDQFRWAFTFLHQFLERWPDHVRQDLERKT